MPPKTKPFEELAAAAGLKQAAIDALKAEEFDSLEAIKCMRDEDAASLKLSRGQSCLLQKWRETLNKRTEKSQPPTSSSDDNSASTSAGAQASANVEVPAGELSVLLNSLSLQDKPGKNLTKVPRPYQMIIGEDYKRASDIKSFAELVSGATVIVENAIENGASDDNILGMCRHLSFIAQKAAQKYTTDSIVQYDDAVRSKIERTTSDSWPMTSDMDLCNRLLRMYMQTDRRKRPQASPAGKKKSDERQVCIRFNQTECKNSNCRYEHVCLICGETHTMKTCSIKKDKGQS